MLAMTTSFFFVEIIVGFIVNSLALVGDSYHMLSDVLALAVGLASVRISKWSSQKNTYGWARAEVLGALVNSVFLVALCFTIFIEALERLVSIERIENPDMMLIVGGLGLAVNIIGLLLFQGHAHSHGGGGHGHSHGGGHSHESHPEKQHLAKKDRGPAANGDVLNAAADASPEGNDSISDDVSEDDRNSDDEVDDQKLRSSAAQLNMRAVFLHVLGDALGSVIVIVSALVIKFVKADWAHRMDPAMSILLVIIILTTTIPLFKESALILLQTVPTHIQVKELHDKLLAQVDGVLAVHEFHIWQLAGNRIIASAHIRCQNLRDYMRIAEDVKSFFHQEGIHSTTIQPEFVEFEEMTGRDCILECGPDKTCFTDTCCALKRDKRGNLVISAAEGVRQRNTAIINSSNDQPPPANNDNSLAEESRRDSDVVVTVSGQDEDTIHSRL